MNTDTMPKQETRQTKPPRKKKKWMSSRHQFLFILAHPIGRWIAHFSYHAKIRKFPDQKKRPYLILYNHQTSYDQCLIGLAFPKIPYFVASEDIFSNGLISRLLTWSVHPIPINKTAPDIHAIVNCIAVAREGGSVAIAPEGNRTYSGKTAFIKPTVASLAKRLRLPIAIFCIEGGYGVQPRWSDTNRRGIVKCGVKYVIEPEEYENMTDAELYDLIRKDLDTDENKTPGLYYSKKSAESLERVFYVCPKCGLSAFESRGDRVRCLGCGLSASYGPDKRFVSEDPDFPYATVGEWYDAQENFVRRLNPGDMTEKPVYTDRARLSQVTLYQSKKLLCRDAEFRLFGDRVELSYEGKKRVLPFGQDGIRAVSILGRNKVNFRVAGEDGKERIFQAKGDRHFNALKYLNFFTHYQNLNCRKEKPDNDGYEFLGL